MPLLHAIFFGLVQGLTEFLPVSSSGHLSLVPWFFGWDDFGSDQALEDAFDVALHIGTLFGAAAYLRVDLARYIGAGLRWIRIGGPPVGDARLACLLGLTAVITAALGLVVMAVGGDLGDRTWVVAAALIGFGLLMWVFDRRPGLLPGSGPSHKAATMEDLTFRRATWLGVAQGLALQPGVSRSGVVLTMARGMGMERSEAARLSFLMGLPVIAGAGLASSFNLSVPAGWWAPFAVGMLASAVSGWIAVNLLLRVVARSGLGGFAAYRVAVGVVVLGLLISGVR